MARRKGKPESFQAPKPLERKRLERLPQAFDVWQPPSLLFCLLCGWPALWGRAAKSWPSAPPMANPTPSGYNPR